MQATIHNEFLTLTVDTHGAEAVSLKNAAGEEMLWQADPAVWKRHAPILFPWTGKLPGGTFEVDGKTYKGGQHGFARDMEHTLLKAEGDTIQLELHSDDAIKAERFPFDFVLTSTFRLDGKTVHHTLAVSNPGSGELRFGIGYHPAFNIPFDDQHTTTDYEFRFDRPESPVILDARPNLVCRTPSVIAGAMPPPSTYFTSTGYGRLCSDGGNALGPSALYRLIHRITVL